MKFTIIAPMYNEEKFIPSWINNTLKLGADEVIVGLDRCTDNSEKLLRPYGFKIVKYDDTPEGYMKSQYHISGWTRDEFEDYGFKTKVVNYLSLPRSLVPFDVARRALTGSWNGKLIIAKKTGEKTNE